MNPKLKSAIESHDITQVLRLLDAEADINKQDSNGETVVTLAVRSGHLGVLDAVLSRKPDVNAVNLDEETPLMLAAEEGDLSMVISLLRSGANKTIGFATSMGNTALIKGILSKNPAVIAPLVSAGASALWCVPTTYGNTPLMFSLGNQDMLETVWEAGAFVSVEIKDLHHGDTALLMAIRMGKEAAFQFLVEKGANVHAIDKEGKSALHLAVLGGHLDMVASLLSHGARMDSRDLSAFVAAHPGEKFTACIVELFGRASLKDLKDIGFFSLKRTLGGPDAQLMEYSRMFSSLP